MAQRQRDPAEFFEQIRANWAFEHLIVAVLSGAGIAGALAFALSIATALLSGASLGAAFAASFFKALAVCFLVFLIGFLSGVVVVGPLYRSLKGARRRTPWPYLGAALVVATAALLLVANMGGAGAVSVSVAAPVIVSSLAIALIFVRRLKPLWEAEEKAEAETLPEPGMNKLH